MTALLSLHHTATGHELDEVMLRAEERIAMTGIVQNNLSNAVDLTMQELDVGLESTPGTTNITLPLDHELFVYHKVTHAVASHSTYGETIVVKFLRTFGDTANILQNLERILDYERRLGALPDDGGKSLSVLLASTHHSMLDLMSLKYNPLSYTNVIQGKDMVENACMVLYYVDTQSQLGLTLQQLANTASRVETGGIELAHMVMQKVLTEFFVLSFYKAIDSYEILSNTPWQWQEPMFFAQYRTMIRDVELLQQMFDDEAVIYATYRNGKV